MQHQTSSAKLIREIHAYFRDLEEWQLVDSIVRDLGNDEEFYRRRAWGRLWKTAIWAVPLLPLALFGVVVFYFPYRWIGHIAVRLAEDETETSTYKFGVGLFAILALSLVLGGIIAYAMGGLGLPWHLSLLGFFVPAAAAVAGIQFSESYKARMSEIRVLLLPRVYHRALELVQIRNTLLEQLWKVFAEGSEG